MSDKPVSTPPHSRCQFYLEKKKRQCRMEPLPQQTFCAQHVPQLDNERVPCPLDPNHSVFKRSLKKHLKKCNARNRNGHNVTFSSFCKFNLFIELKCEVYIDQNINVVSKEEEEHDQAKISLRDIPREKLLNLIQRVESVELEEIKECVYDHPVVRKEIERCTSISREDSGPMRHLEQQASLIGTIKKHDLLKPHSCFVELGAGRGKLLHFVRLASGDCSDFLAVDKDNTRLKFDRFHKNTEDSQLERIKADIANLVLENVPIISTRKKPIVVVGKHVCGQATDLSLACTINAMVKHKSFNKSMSERNHEQDPKSKRQKLETETDAPKEKQKEFAVGVRGIVLAPCCHQVCKWSRYCNPEYFRSLGFTPFEFRCISLMSSWAVCGTRSSKEHESDEHDQQSCSQSAQILDSKDEQETSSHVKKSWLSQKEMELIGFRCKRLIDMGRLIYLRQHGFEAWMQFYVPKSISPENVVIVAKKLE
eukprot:m.93947 g.93947  ORF g.93947 m.93947 type:complete len:480 (-) comp13422_c0_seq1:178-1617(-)